MAVGSTPHRRVRSRGHIWGPRQAAARRRQCRPRRPSRTPLSRVVHLNGRADRRLMRSRSTPRRRAGYRRRSATRTCTSCRCSASCSPPVAPSGPTDASPWASAEIASQSSLTPSATAARCSLGSSGLGFIYGEHRIDTGPIQLDAPHLRPIDRDELEAATSGNADPQAEWECADGTGIPIGRTANPIEPAGEHH